MEKEFILKEITQEASQLKESDLKEAYDFIKFLRNREFIDPTLELMQNSEEYLNVKEGLRQKKEGKVLDWDEVK
jgi:hypothetical protein